MFAKTRQFSGYLIELPLTHAPCILNFSSMSECARRDRLYEMSSRTILSVSASGRLCCAGLVEPWTYGRTANKDSAIKIYQTSFQTARNNDVPPFSNALRVA